MFDALISLTPPVLPGPERFPSSSPDAAVSLTTPSRPDDYCQFQELLRRVAEALYIPLEEVQDSQHLMRILHALVLAQSGTTNQQCHSPTRLHRLAYPSNLRTHSEGGGKRGTMYQRRGLSFCFLTPHPISWLFKLLLNGPEAAPTFHSN